MTFRTHLLGASEKAHCGKVIFIIKYSVPATNNDVNRLCFTTAEQIVNTALKKSCIGQVPMLFPVTQKQGSSNIFIQKT